jgi:hypothetical protein
MARAKRYRSKKRRSAGPLTAVVLVVLVGAAVAVGYYAPHIWPAVKDSDSATRARDPSPAAPNSKRPSSSRVARLLDDEAAILDNAQTQRLAALHASLLRQHDIDLRVVTVEGAEPIDRTTLDRYAAMRVGSRSKTRRGVLLLVDALARMARVRLGPELDEIYPERFTNFVETELLLYYFQNERIAQGVIVAAEWIARRAADADAKRPFVRPANFDARKPPPRPIDGSNADSASRKRLPPAARVAPSATSPLATFRRYLQALANGDGRAELPIYSTESQRLLSARQPTRAQMSALVGTYERCPDPIIKRKRSLAVLRFPKRKRRCAPYFLRRERGAWRLDLATMSRVVRYNQRGQWHLARGAEHAYAFAFRDWRFDYYGFPR